MNRDCIKKNMSEYEFLTLFVSAATMLEKDPVVNGEDLETKLYNYSQDSNYRFLFENFLHDREEKKVDLKEGFDYCYSFGILVKSEDKNISIINITDNEAKQIIGKSNLFDVKAMYELCEDYYSNKKQNKAMIKK